VAGIHGRSHPTSTNIASYEYLRRKHGISATLLLIIFSPGVVITIS
jgi:hypothetical protein